MSLPLIVRSPDLQRLQADGYNIEIRNGYLLVRDVPYVSATKEVKFGTIVSDLTLAGDVTTRPSDHQVYFVGDYPCDEHGKFMLGMGTPSGGQAFDLGGQLVAQHRFSAKPPAGYADYYEKMKTYADMLTGPATYVLPGVTACTYPVIETAEGESVFKYIDTASGRAGIGRISEKLEVNRVAIVGLGGTGSYVLDLLAKTPVGEIHVFDGDLFHQHNAFRAPGAPSRSDLQRKLSKVAHFGGIYSNMRKGIVEHPCMVDQTNVELLKDMNYVFICVDDGPTKKIVVEKLQSWEIPFVDVGMGIIESNGALTGVLRVTSSSAKMKKHISEQNRISFGKGAENNEYDRNIQIADLNMLNAALAVVRWKKDQGFYHDLEHEHHSTYTIDGNCSLNEDQA